MDPCSAHRNTSSQVKGIVNIPFPIINETDIFMAELITLYHQVTVIANSTLNFTVQSSNMLQIYYGMEDSSITTSMTTIATPNKTKHQDFVSITTYPNETDTPDMRSTSNLIILEGYQFGLIMVAPALFLLAAAIIAIIILYKKGML